MKAAVVHEFGKPPRFEAFDAPTPGQGEVLIHVQAAALSQLVRAQASGKHYSAGGKLPLVPGVDGVGTTAQGARVYFAFPRGVFGSMAEQSVVPANLTIPVPDGLDSALAAGIANPGMSSWAALTERAHLQPGETVLINGATGTSGSLAVQIARHLGAARIIVTGRNQTALDDLQRHGADATIQLQQEPDALKKAFAQQIEQGVDVVLDYLWGPPAEQLIAACAGQGSDAPKPVRFVQIGNMAAASISLPATPLRSSRLELLGSGIGSVSKPRLLACIAGVLQATAQVKLQMDIETVPLQQVEETWGKKTGDRVVFQV